MRCPDCDIALTHHRTDDMALCHYCDYRVPRPGDLSSLRFLGNPL